MSKRVLTLSMLAVAAMLLAAGPVLAHCGSCGVGDAKDAKAADHDHGDKMMTKVSPVAASEDGHAGCAAKCAAAIKSGGDVCAGCAAKLAASDAVCGKCQAALKANGAQADVCSHCQAKAAAVLTAGAQPKADGKKCGDGCACKATGASLAEIGKPAPLFVLSDQDGETHALKDLRGKIVVLEWVNWDCPFIKRHVKEETAKKLVQKYDGKEVVWLAVNSTKGTTPADDKKVVAEHKLPYDVLSDRDGRVGRLYAAKTTPDIRVIDARGVLVYAGGIDDDPRGNKDARTSYVDQALAALTSGKQVSTAQAKPYGCSVKYAPATEAPAFTLTDHDGKPHSLADYRGRVVVLEWTNWDCPFVKYHRKVDTTKNLAAEYEGKGVVWLLVNSTSGYSASQDKALAEEHKVGVPVLGDYAGNVGQAYGAKTTPHMYVIDPSGVIAYNGAIDDNPLGKKDQTTNYVQVALDELLAGKSVSTPQAKPYGCSVKYAKGKQASAQ